VLYRIPLIVYWTDKHAIQAYDDIQGIRCTEATDHVGRNATLL
jgi:hypothetical protein